VERRENQVKAEAKESARVGSFARRMLKELGEPVQRPCEVKEREQKLRI
jgi:hypothetical protein